MHLLVVEDDRRLGRLLKRLLEGDRHLVELAATGEQALDVLDGAALDAVIWTSACPTSAASRSRAACEMAATRRPS
jgi:DNA-binding response OmpR family regulator